MNQTTYPSPNRAFTLIELLVVFAVLAVLIGLLLPVISRMTERSRQVQCVSNLRQIDGALLTYASDHNGTVPSEGGYAAGLEPYLGQKDAISGVFRCPTGWAAGARTSNHTQTYLYNYHPTPFNNPSAVSGSGAEAFTWYTTPKLAAFVHPSQTITFLCWWEFQYVGSPIAPQPPRCTHNGGRPTAYLDGHVQFETNPTFWTNGTPPYTAMTAY